MAASSWGSLIRQQLDRSSLVLVIERGAGRCGSGWGRGSSRTAVRNWLTVATAANCA
ncbi:hypothetical protein I552_3835 [Mycobacterium xenopi 3993]|nr:hypothetical protein I552_3835 [Mycobacterium xenopi 3993]